MHSVNAVDEVQITEVSSVTADFSTKSSKGAWDIDAAKMMKCQSWRGTAAEWRLRLLLVGGKLLLGRTALTTAMEMMAKDEDGGCAGR